MVIRQKKTEITIGNMSNLILIYNLVKESGDKGNVESVSLGDSHSAAIDTDGNLWIWGFNFIYDESENGEDSYVPVKIKENIKSVSLGFSHSAAIDTDGNLWMWGQNDHGQLGNGKKIEFSNVPIKVELKTSGVSNGYMTAADFATDLSMAVDCFGESDGNDVSIGLDRLSGDGSFSINGNKLDFSELDTNSIYNIYSLRKGDTMTPLSAGNLLYITQKTSDENGALSVNYSPKESVTDPYVVAVKQRDPVRYVSAKAVSISESDLKMKKGEVVALSAEVTPNDATEKSVSWESTDTNIATVDNSGKVTAVGKGTAFICATSKDGGYKVYCSVYVGASDAGSLTIVAGQKIDLKEACFSDIDETISRYVVSDKKIAYVTKGMLSGKKTGTVKVTAQKKMADDNYEDLAICTVTIFSKPKLKFSRHMTYEGQTFNGPEYFTTSDTNILGATYWESSNSSVVEVTDPLAGTLVARKDGSVKITAYFGEKGKKGTLKVSAKLSVKKPTYKKSSYNIKTGGKISLAMKNVTVALNPEWVTLDPEIATATPQLNKKAVPTGKVTITALKAGDTRLKAIIDGQECFCNLHVEAPVISKKEKTLKVNKTATISLKNTKLNKNSIEWYSTDPIVASVSAGGKIKALSPGTAIIYTETGGVRNECVVTVK